MEEHNMNIIKSIFKSRDRPQNHTGDSVGGGRYFPFGRTWAGKSVTERSAMQTTAVYACVRIISETVASLPLHVYEYTDNGKERVCNHPLYRLLHDIPNPEMNSFVMREVMMSHLLLWGKEIDILERQSEMEKQLNAPVNSPILATPAVGTDIKTGRASNEYKNAFWKAMRNKNSYGEPHGACSDRRTAAVCK
jgi:hypothetical protein